jgi:phage terminase small subunit
MPTSPKGTTKPAAKAKAPAKRKPRAKAKPAVVAGIEPIAPDENRAKSGDTIHKVLTEKEAMFCEHYVEVLNAAEAARRAGYSEKNARQTGYELLTKPYIQLRIRQLKRERIKRVRWNADMVLDRLGDELDADLADLYDEMGNLLPIHEWPLAWRTGLVAGVETEELFEGAGEDRVHIGRVKKLKLSDRLKRLELVGKHVEVNAFKERSEVEAGGTLTQLLGALAGTPLLPVNAPPVANAPLLTPLAPTPGTNPDLTDDDEDEDDEEEGADQ